MNAQIVTKAALEAVKTLANIVPQIVQQLGPQAFAKAHVIREIGKVAPYVVAALGSGVTWALYKLFSKDSVRIVAAHGSSGIAIEGKSRSKAKTAKASQRPELNGGRKRVGTYNLESQSPISKATRSITNKK